MMNTKTVTAQNCSLFEIDAELEQAFDQLQEEREITGTFQQFSENPTFSDVLYSWPLVTVVDGLLKPMRRRLQLTKT